ncbi:MAG: MdtA/MuxA family multidrug efflux RND transporter periplasmic adaptor subunit [Proteobacteria bacterium]|nr:MdtA/MuxA family multidrug efflux RND transporter periplasmic adaptor subunit [Pseudomonadota bacterium]
MKRLRTLVGIGLGLVVIAAGGWYIATHSGKPTTTATGGRGARGGGVPTTVGLATAAKGDIPIILKALGTVTPLANVTVKTQITGQLQAVTFTEGQAVKKGDLLAQVDPRPYDVALQQAVGTLEKDKATLANAQVDLARYQKLVSQDSIARQQLDTQAALVRQLQATVLTDEAGVDAAKLNLTYTRIVAPTDGRIGLRLVDPGNYVTIGDATGICTITLMQPMSVLFTIPEDSLPQVRKRLKDGATLDVTALDRAQKNTLGTGKLSSTDNQVDTTTGTVKMRALFDNKDESLFPNQFVNVRLLVDTVKDATVVPVAAIQRGQPGIFVYLAQPDDTVKIQVVEIGVTDGEKIAVTKGLNVGDNVVTDGVDRLREGAKIRRPGAPSGRGGNRPNATPGQGAAATPPATSEAPGATNAPQTGEAPPASARPQQQGQQQGERHGNGQRRGGAGQPAQSNQ